MTVIDTASAAADEAELDENAAALAACEAEAKRAGLARLPRRGEDRDSYVLTVARHRGLIAQDAHIRDVPGTVKTLLDRAGDDELMAGSPASRALVAAAAIHRRLNSELTGVGELRASGRRGVHLAVAHLVLELQQDPTRGQRLSEAEAALVRFYTTDELRQAVDELGPAIDAAHARVAEAAKTELARPLYDGLVPRAPVPQEAPVVSFVDTRGLKDGDVLPAFPGQAGPQAVATPAHLRGPRGW